MMTIPANLAAFQTVWAIDTEFVIAPGEPFDPVMLAVQNVISGQTQVYRRDAMLRWTQLPFRNDRHTLLVCFNASAEAGLLQALGLETDAWWLCLMAESRLQRNVCIPDKQLKTFAAQHLDIYRPNANITLLEAADQAGIPGTDADTKALSRDLIITRQWETGDETIWQQIETYCLSDVQLTAALFLKMEPLLDLQTALVRGAYAAEHGRMTARGMPIDVETLARLKHHHAPLLSQLRQQADPDDTRLTPKARIRQPWLRAKLTSLGVLTRHPRTPSGALSARVRDVRKTVEDVNDTELENVLQLQELMALFPENKDGGLRSPALGHDGRIRYDQIVFRTHTGRSLGLGKEALMQMPRWLRGLIQPSGTETLLHADYHAQEFAVGAALSQDMHMQEAYREQDPYIAVGLMAGLLTTTSTPEQVRQVRQLCKSCTLGRMYGMGLESFRQRSGISYAQAAKVWRFYDRTFTKFRDWQEQVVRQARRQGWIRTRFGWRAQVFAETKKTTLLNWAIQAGASDVLRLAVLMLAEARFALLTTVHDSIIASVPDGYTDECHAHFLHLMQEAARAAVGLTIRVDAQVIRPGERLLAGDTQASWDRVICLLDTQ